MSAIELERPFDWKNPDYVPIFQQRQINLQKLRESPNLLKAAKVHYRNNPWDFVIDWGMTFDPRAISEGRIATLPFMMFPRQVELIKWIYESWRMGEDGLVEKSRDFGVTWVAVAFACTEWLFEPGFSAGFGSRKEELVDKKGDPDCIFEKVRAYIDSVPDVFMPKDFNPRVHSGFKKLINPENEATVTGEAGDDIGRGGRKSIYFVDEAAFIQHQLSVDNALSQTTNCKIDISTYNGSGNEFYKKAERFKGTRRKFVCDWHDDPRKDEAWYTKQVENRNPVTVAQEIDRDPHASIAGILIPSKWVKAAIDLHKLIQIPPSGIRTTSFDPADEGLDPKGTLTRYGYVVTQCDIWVEGDITDALPRAYGTADQQNADVLVYDADGMGAPVIKTDLQYRAAGRTKVLPFYGSGAVEEPDMKYVQPGGDPKDPLLKANKDMFANYRAQKAIKLRDRFHQSYMIRKAIEKGGVALNVDTESIISIDSSVASFFDLETDISRPLEKWSPNGKFRVESKQEMAAREVDSPTGFDLLMMAFAQEAPRPQKRRKDRKVRRHAVRDRGVGM